MNSNSTIVIMLCLSIAACADPVSPPSNTPDAEDGSTTTEKADSTVADATDDTSKQLIDASGSLVDTAIAQADTPDGDAAEGDAWYNQCPKPHDLLPKGPNSSKKPCLCYPTGGHCKLISNGNEVTPDPELVCPTGEVCTGGIDVVSSGGAKFGVCERPCSFPTASVKSEFGCGVGSHCGPSTIAYYGPEPVVIATIGVCLAGPDPCHTSSKPSGEK